MAIRTIVAIVVTFVVWAGMDYLLHDVILAGQYEASRHLWRPGAEMKSLFWVYGVGLAIMTTCFVLIYACLVRNKCACSGLWYGLLFGIAGGAGMAYCSYPFSETPYVMAQAWFIGYAIEGLIAGLIVALIIGRCSAAKAEEVAKTD